MDGEITKENEIDYFRRTLARLNRSVELDSVGPLDRHVISTFNKLSDLSKIQVLMSCCLHMENTVCGTGPAGLQQEFVLVDARPGHRGEHPPEQKVVKQELSEIDKTNQIELIRLKTWSVRALISFLMMSILLGVAVALLSGREVAGSVGKNAEWLIKILEVVFF